MCVCVNFTCKGLKMESFLVFFLITSCWFSQHNVEHMDRFAAKFGSEEEKGNDEMGEKGQESGSANPRKSYKGSDFQILFGGNNEDNFMIGINFTR